MAYTEFNLEAFLRLAAKLSVNSGVVDADRRVKASQATPEQIRAWIFWRGSMGNAEASLGFLRSSLPHAFEGIAIENMQLAYAFATVDNDLPAALQTIYNALVADAGRRFVLAAQRLLDPDTFRQLAIDATSYLELGDIRAVVGSEHIEYGPEPDLPAGN